jgi:hypothetical protein
MTFPRPDSQVTADAGETARQSREGAPLPSDAETEGRDRGGSRLAARRGDSCCVTAVLGPGPDIIDRPSSIAEVVHHPYRRGGPGQCVDDVVAGLVTESLSK